MSYPICIQYVQIYVEMQKIFPKKVNNSTVHSSGKLKEIIN